MAEWAVAPMSPISWFVRGAASFSFASFGSRASATQGKANSEEIRGAPESLRDLPESDRFNNEKTGCGVRFPPSTTLTWGYIGRNAQLDAKKTRMAPADCRGMPL